MPKVKKEEELDIKDIDKAVFKYGGSSRDSSESISGFGRMTQNTPFKGIKTQMSFRVGGGGGAWDIRKAETITMDFPTILKQNKPIDSCLYQLSMLKACFKAQKVTLFVIDEVIQKTIFVNKKERQLNYKKLMFNGSKIIYALFAESGDFCGPEFHTEDEFSSYKVNT